MSSPVNFTEQYTRAKRTIEDAISHNKTIVVCGDECTGKSHVVQELWEKLLEKKYSKYYYDSNYENEIQYNTPCIVEAKSMDCLKHLHRFVSNDELGVVFVNMNYCKYPEYSKTRSGKIMNV